MGRWRPCVFQVDEFDLGNLGSPLLTRGRRGDEERQEGHGERDGEACEGA